MRLSKNIILNNKYFVLSFLMISVAAYILGILLPSFSTTKFYFFHEDISIVKSFYFLFENGEFFLGVVLFTFTILFPSVKPKLRIRKRNRESKCPGFVPKTPEPFPSF